MFEFLDRQGSFHILALSIEKRLSLNHTQTDRNNHPLPFLADGPGSGKSRFLDELSVSFRTYVADNSEKYPRLATFLESALFLSVTFGNGTAYGQMEVGKIEQALSSRILRTFLNNADEYVEGMGSRHLKKTLDYVLSRGKYSGVFLGIDEVNRVHDISSADFKCLFNLAGSLSCCFKPFLVPVLAGTIIGRIVPVLAGTIIGRIQDIVSTSTHPPLHIPLPLLSFDSSLQVIIHAVKTDKKMTKSAASYLRHLVMDMGGHCRALEFLYDVLKRGDSWMRGEHLDDIMTEVQVTLKQRYPMASISMEGLIAAAFLSLSVSQRGTVHGTNNLDFLDFEERGVAKLEPVDNGRAYKVLIPYVFASTALGFGCVSEVGCFWKALLWNQDYWWQDWEKFSCNYFAFRLSLFSYLEHKKLSLSTYFSGAKCNLVADTHFRVPSLGEISAPQKLSSRFPENKGDFESYVFVLNADGAPFDAFVYLDTLDNKKILLAFQMKFSNRATKNPRPLSLALLEAELTKARGAVAEHLPGTELVLVFPAHCDKAPDLTADTIPAGCIIITKDEERDVYGELYYHRLERL